MSDEERVEVKHRPLADKGSFVAERDGKRAGILTYALRDGTVVAEHTFVEPQFRGSPVAPSLVAALAEWARSEGRKVEPMCSYVRGVFDRTPGYADLRVGG